MMIGFPSLRVSSRTHREAMRGSRLGNVAAYESRPSRRRGVPERGVRARGTGDGLRWLSVLVGWQVAFMSGLIVTSALWTFYSAAIGGSTHRGELTAGVVAVCMVSGFVAHLIGGGLAGHLAEGCGGLHGRLTATVGLVAGAILTPTLATYGETFLIGVAAPPASFGLTAVALFCGILLFGSNLLGGYFGGKLAESS